jgi:hypothetical protein
MAKSLKNMMGVGIGAESATLSNVPAGSGVRLPASPQPGDEYLVANLGANSLAVYPPPGATIQGGAPDAPFSLPVGAIAEFIARIGSANWIILATGGSLSGVGSPGKLDFSIFANSGLLAVLEDDFA